MEGKSRRRRTELEKKSCEKKIKIEDNEVEPRVSYGRKFLKMRKEKQEKLKGWVSVRVKQIVWLGKKGEVKINKLK